VNGSKLSLHVRPGTFTSNRRKGNAGDGIELRLPATLELLSVDSKQPDTVAVSYGSLRLFAVTDVVPSVPRVQLTAAKQVRPGGGEWLAEPNNGPLRLTAFLGNRS
jgi:hypothetical protein